MSRTPKQQERLKRRLYLTRDCGTCKVCCTIMPVPQMDKPAGQACPKWDAERHGGGCTVYETRPQVCREWACVWRSGSNVVEPQERPDRLGIMLDTMRPVEGHPNVRAILVYETEPGGFDKADATIRRLTEKWAVVLMSDPRQLFGPDVEVANFLRDVPELERP